ncbi:hypothetical protein Hammaste2_00005 [Pseudomonas phage vB_PpuP-Hammaste-2]
MTKASECRLDISSMAVFLRKLRLANPTIVLTVKPSAFDGKVVVFSEHPAHQEIVCRVIRNL